MAPDRQLGGCKSRPVHVTFHTAKGETMRYWFDTKSGAFGDARHLVVAEIPDEEVEEIECMSDSDRIAYAKEQKLDQEEEFTFLVDLHDEVEKWERATEHCHTDGQRAECREIAEDLRKVLRHYGLLYDKESS